MKKFALLGTAFFLAALIGVGISASLAPNAQATVICDEDEFQYYCIEDDPVCRNAQFKAGVYHCGTEWPTGDPCACTFIGCFKGCAQPL